MLAGYLNDFAHVAKFAIRSRLVRRMRAAICSDAWAAPFASVLLRL